MDTNTLILGGGLAAVTVGFLAQSIQMRSQRRQHLHEKAELERALRVARLNASLADTDKRAALDRAERAEAAATVHRLHTISASSQAPRPRYDRPATHYPARTSHARDDDHTEFGPVSAMNWQMRQDDEDNSDSGSSDSGSSCSSGD